MGKNSKVILVTGAANGIGFAITDYLAKKGDHVIATDIDKDALEKLNEKENITPLLMNVTDSQSIEKVKKTVLKITEGLDGLVNNAGIFVGGPLVEVSEQNMEKIFKVNVFGVHNVTRAFYPMLLEKKGRIVNIGSETGRIAFPVNGPYSMTKFALEAFSDSLRREAMFHGIKVIHLQVGAIKTGFQDQTYCAYAEDIDLEKTLYRNLIEQVIDTCENEFEKSSDPVHVAKTVYNVLHKKHVKTRYKVKNHKGRRLLEFLPTALLDFAMLKSLK